MPPAGLGQYCSDIAEVSVMELDVPGGKIPMTCFCLLSVVNVVLKSENLFMTGAFN